MKIAVAYKDGEVFQHFGHTEQFKIYDIEENKIKNEKVVNTNGSGHEELADLLKEYDVDTLICGGIGGDAKNALTDAGIKLYGGVTGKADIAVNSFISGNLNFNPNVICNNHVKENSEHHACGRNGCY